MLKWQNPEVLLSDWEVVSVRREGDKQQVSLKISMESCNMIASNNGRLAWGMGSVYVYVKKPKDDNKEDKKEPAGPTAMETSAENELPKAAASSNDDDAKMEEPLEQPKTSDDVAKQSNTIDTRTEGQ